MRISATLAAALAAGAFALAALSPAHAEERIGQVKVMSGEVTIHRDGATTPGAPGTDLLQGDVVETGVNSSVGMTFTDNSRISLGPESSLEVESYAFNSPGAEDAFDARLARGSLTAASGGIAAARPLAMRVLMPTTVLAVRGTAFAVRVGEE